MLQEKVTIISNTRLNEAFAHMSFRAEKIAPQIKCGQFVYMRLTEGVEPLLRRPFSVAWVEGDAVNIVYKIVGKGTNMMADFAPGTVLDVMGPLGKGYDFKPERETVLVAGGIGIASLISLTRMCVQKGIRLFYGARTEAEFISQSFLSLDADHITYVTEDGSRGEKGYVTAPLEKYLLENKDKDPFVYTCGPLPMLESIVKMANRIGIEGEANLEERMGCGVGACLGCATQTINGTQMVCKDGPVFHFDELGWKE